MRDEQDSARGITTSERAEVMQDHGLVTVDLRILATTDIHMQFLGYDYARDRPLEHAGLAGLASMIKAARQEAHDSGMACMLLDNGDLLQGTALENTMLGTPVTPDHPLVASLNHIAYDAYGVGNHDLDHGLAYLKAVAAHLNAPVISSNLRLQEPGAVCTSAVISLPAVNDTDGGLHNLKIGLVSALPEKTAQWNARELAGEGTIDPIVASSEQAVEEVRRQGADIVVLLAHLGVENPTHTGGISDDDARALADITGVDAIILGHTHRRLPGLDHAGFARVDIQNGALGRRPSAMAGFDASDLATIDLRLGRGPSDRWEVYKHNTGLRPNSSKVPPDPTILRLCRPAHQATRDALSRCCGNIVRPLHNFFSLAKPTSTCALMANAKWHAIQQGLIGLPEAELPLLASAAAHTSGGRGGPGHFLHVPAGPILGRHMAALSPYANSIWALRVSGQDLLDWLENAASVYTQLRHDKPDQRLVQESRPPFDFDTIYGLDYLIDPTQPEGARLRNVTYAGQPIAPDQMFVLATNNFRAAGGGGGKAFTEDQVLQRSTMPVTTAMAHVLAMDVPPFALDAQPWQFAPSLGVKAVLSCAPDSAIHLNEIAHLSPRLAGSDAAGFTRVNLTL